MTVGTAPTSCPRTGFRPMCTLQAVRIDRPYRRDVRPWTEKHQVRPHRPLLKRGPLRSGLHLSCSARGTVPLSITTDGPDPSGTGHQRQPRRENIGCVQLDCSDLVSYFSMATEELFSESSESLNAVDDRCGPPPLLYSW
jgi:hypothetical protein